MPAVRSEPLVILSKEYEHYQRIQAKWSRLDKPVLSQHLSLKSREYFDLDNKLGTMVFYDREKQFLMTLFGDGVGWLLYDGFKQEALR